MRVNKEYVLSVSGELVSSFCYYFWKVNSNRNEKVYFKDLHWYRPDLGGNSLLNQAA